MLVSWNWLTQYVDLKLDHDELVDRLSLSGLNHEGTEVVDGDRVIDLEVTSNRGDCLGHLGVAREIALLTGQSLRVPEVASAMGVGPDQIKIDNDHPAACPRFTARVIRGVSVGPSPEWMQTALRSIGLTPVNNVVDVTNYVMMECGNPLHAFDAAKIQGDTIVVRPGLEGEKIEAIDHRTYEVDPWFCMIADRQKALSIAGVMGGAGSEVNDSTTDVVIEVAQFTPLFVRRAARRLKLSSGASFRFERKVDPEGVDWASRRACQLILELAGGTIAGDLAQSAEPMIDREAISLRDRSAARLLGVAIDRNETDRILQGLGCVRAAQSRGDVTDWTPPTWRHDLTREVDLIEEIARIAGYHRIPENAPVPVTASTTRPFEAVRRRITQVMVAAGCSEAMTPSVVTSELDGMLSPFSDVPPVQTRTPLIGGARSLRRSLIPSLLASRSANWASASRHADLFEIAHVYLPPPGNRSENLPAEEYHVGLVSGADYFDVKGLVAELVTRLGIDEPMSVAMIDVDGMAAGTAITLKLGETVFGVMGRVSSSLTQSLKLSGDVVVAELQLPPLVEASRLVPQQRSVSGFPTIRRDLNLIVDQSVRWADLAASVRRGGGELVRDLDYVETFRKPEVDGADTKRMLISVELQSDRETLSGDQADAAVAGILEAVGSDVGARLLG